MAGRDDIPEVRKPEISIIVPVYNVGKYLPQCLDSILSQTFEDWECWLVDDGSIDDSGKICDNYAERDSRFKIIHKSNGGQSSARNVALEKAAGKYITFIDSDDWVDRDFLETLRDLLVKNDADVSQTGFSKDFRGFVRKKPLVNAECVLEGEKIARELLKDSSLPSFLWNKMFKREVIDSPFPEGQIYEDFFVMTKWWPNIKRIAMSPRLTYHYRMRGSSSISMKNAKNLYDFVLGHQFRAQQLKDRLPQSFSSDDITAYLYRNYVKAAKQIARAEKEEATAKELVGKIIEQLHRLPPPEIDLLGKKLYSRTMLLLSQPDKFIKKMRALQNFDLHTKFCNSRRYE